LDIEIVFSHGISQIVVSGFPFRCGALEADLFPRCRVFSDQRTDGVEDRTELPVISFLEPVEAAHEVRAARLLRSTLDSIATPCSVNARGRFRGRGPAADQTDRRSALVNRRSIGRR